MRPVAPQQNTEQLAEHPRERWARIAIAEPTNGVGAFTRVAGLPNLARLVRLAARAKLDGAVIQGGDADAIQAVLRSWPAPSGFRIEVTPAAAPIEGRTYLDLDGAAVFAAGELDAAEAEQRAPKPLVTLTSRADARRATSELIARTKKSIDADGIVAYFIFRPISRTITRVLLHTRVTPNMISVLAGLFGIAAAICAGLGTAQLVALAGALYWFGAVIDCVDGELARLRLQGSKLGEWIDSVADDVSTYGLLAGLGIGLTRHGEPDAWAWAASIGGATGLVFNLKLCADLARWGMVVDTARYPWFFGSPAEGDASKRSFVGKIIYAFNFLLRRDAFATMVAVALVLGYPKAAVIGFLAGVALFTVMFLVHGVVVSVRRKPGEESFWAIGYFGIKDLFTIINLLGGVIGIVLAFRGELAYAGYAIFAGYLLGDVLDGPVARLTATSNRFGGEFDAAADHISQAIAPAIMVFVAYSSAGHDTLGIALLATLITTASIRQARFACEPFNYPLTYCGLPRTVSGIVTLSLINSLLFFKHSVLGYNGAAAVLVLTALLNLAPIPYMTHKGRKIQGYVKPFVAAFLVIPPLMLFFARDFVFDFLFFITFGYALGAWIPVKPEERREFWAEYKRWSAVVASRK